jgi:Ni/Fe-hydrogenase 1 B-type cytochrome subunit
MSHTQTHEEKSVYVYQAPVRLWHWINAFAILTLCGTGYLIGSPPPTLSGEPSSHFLFGYIRFAHFMAGYVMIIGFVFRAYWTAVGNEHARQIFFPPLYSPTFWKEVVHEVLWYLMLVKEPKKYVGHNPLAALVMHFGVIWVSIFMMATGLALYGEGEGMGSWQFDYFSSWIIPLFGGSQAVHTYHHLGMWAILIFIVVHIYAAVREDIMSRQSIISSMFSGWRSFRDDN